MKNTAEQFAATNKANLQALQGFTAQAGVDQYVDVADATPGTLAKLARFVSHSISSQSQSLGTGGPSLALVF